MSKVIALVASKRPNANSQILVETCLEAIKGSGLETEIIFLDRLNIEHCRGCLACVYKGKCSLNDDMASLLPKITAADGLILAAPTYLFSPASLIKKVIDRGLMLTPYLAALENRVRKALCLSVAGNTRWNTLGLVQVSQLALAYGYEIFATKEISATGPGEVILQDSTLEELRRLSTVLAATLRADSGTVSTGLDQFPLNSATVNNTATVANSGEYNCPFCKNQVFRFRAAGNIQCAACGAEGLLISKNNQVKIEFKPGNLQENFFAIAQRIEHAGKYMQESKAEFLRKRQEIEQKLSKRVK